VKCTCTLFELRGILCRHSISVLVTKKVRMLPSRYFLDIWRKDIKREYSMNKSSFDAVDDNPNAQMHDKIINNLEELISLASRSVERCMDVMYNIDKLKEKFREINLAPSHSSHSISIAVASSSCNEVVKSDKVLSPIKVKRKGKPPTTEKVPVIEKVPNKSQVLSKPLIDNNGKQKRQKNQVATFFPPPLLKNMCISPHRFLLHYTLNTFRQPFLVVGFQSNRRSIQHISNFMPSAAHNHIIHNQVINQYIFIYQFIVDNYVIFHVLI
jgi:hypothetical protein